MRRWFYVAGLSSLIGSLVAGCDSNESSLRIIRIVPPEDECAFEAGGDKDYFGYTLDLAAYKRLNPVFEFRNLLRAPPTTLGNDPGRQTILTPPQGVIPQRFEVRWECDSNGFTTDLGPLVVPAFSPTQPFCLDRRADVTEEFRGFDVVPAVGAMAEPNESSLFTAAVVPFELGLAIDDALTIGRLADACCRDPNSNCDGFNDANPACRELNDIFEAIAPDELSVKSTQAGVPSEDLVRFRPFGQFDGTYIGQLDPRTLGAPLGPSYRMRYRAVLEAVSVTGALQLSSPYSDTVSFCKNCGFPSGAGRSPLITLPNDCASID